MLCNSCVPCYHITFLSHLFYTFLFCSCFSGAYQRWKGGSFTCSSVIDQSPLHSIISLIKQNLTSELLISTARAHHALGLHRTMAMRYLRTMLQSTTAHVPLMHLLGVLTTALQTAAAQQSAMSSASENGKQTPSSAGANGSSASAAASSSASSSAQTSSSYLHLLNDIPCCDKLTKQKLMNGFDTLLPQLLKIFASDQSAVTCKLLALSGEHCLVTLACIVLELSFVVFQRKSDV